MFFILPSILFLLLLSVLSFQRYRQERQRQQTLTWPRGPAILSDLPDTLLPAKRGLLQQQTYYRAELVEPYVFHAHARRYTGNWTAPTVPNLERSAISLLLRPAAQLR